MLQLRACLGCSEQQLCVQMAFQIALRPKSKTLHNIVVSIFGLSFPSISSRCPLYNPYLTPIYPTYNPYITPIYPPYNPYITPILDLFFGCFDMCAVGIPFSVEKACFEIFLWHIGAILVGIMEKKMGITLMGYTGFI